MVAETGVDFRINGQDDSKRAFVSLQQSLRKTSQTLNVIQGPLGPLAGRFSALTTALGNLNPVALAAGAGFTSLTFALQKGIRQYAQTQEQLLKIEAQLKSTQGAAGLTADELEGMAQSIARETLASLEGVRAAEGILLSFRRVNGDTFEEALRLAQDLSASGYGDLSTQAKALGKALQDPILGLTSLSRQGVTFSQKQKDVIKAMVDTGDIAEAQRLILEEVALTVGGTGKAGGTGLSGAFDNASQSMENFWVAAGKSSAGVGFTAVVNGMANAVQGLADALTDVENMDNAALDRRLATLRKDRDELAKKNELTGGRDKTLQARIDQVDEQIFQVQTLINLRELESRKAREVGAAKQAELDADEKRTAMQEKAKKQAEESAKAFQKIKDLLDPIAKLQSEFVIRQNTILENTKAESEEQAVLLKLSRERFDKDLERIQKVDKETKKITDNTSDAAKEIGSAFADAFRAGIVEAQKLSDVVNNLAKQVANAIIQGAILTPISNSIAGIIPSFGTPGAGTQVTNQATGGVIRSGLTRMNEFGPELVKLPSGSRVIPNKDIGGGGVVINNNALPPEQVQATEQPDGSVIIDLIDSRVDAAMNGNGVAGRNFTRQFGLQRQGATR